MKEPTSGREWFEHVLTTTGLKARALGELVGLHPSVVSRIRNGKRELRIKDVEAISNRTGIPFPAYLRREGATWHAGSKLDDYTIMREAENLFSRLDLSARKYLLERLNKLAAGAH